MNRPKTLASVVICLLFSAIVLMGLTTIPMTNFGDQSHLMVRNGKYFCLSDDSEADTAYMYHDGTNLIITGDGGTGAIEFGLAVRFDLAGGSLELSDGTLLYFTDGTEADSANIYHDGTAIVLTGDAGTSDLKLLDVGVLVADGEKIYWTDDSEADTGYIYHSGTDMIMYGDAGTSFYNFTTSIWVDKTAGEVMLSDGAFLRLTDGSEADSASLVHDGASLVLTGDAATDNLELEALNLELQNGGLIENPHIDSITLTEAYFKVEGSMVMDVAGGVLLVEDGSYLMLTDGSEADTTTFVHDGTNLVIAGDAATVDIQLVDVGLLVSDGERIYITDDSEADSISMYHDGASFVVTGDGTDNFELESIDLELTNGAVFTNPTIDTATLTEAYFKVVGSMVMNVAAGCLLIEDGSNLMLTDGSLADSFYIAHDGTDIVLTGDAGTAALELEGIYIELANGGIIDNPHTDTVSIAEGNIAIEGNLWLDAAAGALTITDGSFLRFTDGAETDSGSIVHDGTDIVLDADAATESFRFNDGIVKLGSSEWKDGCLYIKCLNKSGGSLTKGMWVEWDSTHIEVLDTVGYSGAGNDTFTLDNSLLNEGGANKLLFYPMSIADACSVDFVYWDMDGASQRDTIVLTVDDTFVAFGTLVDSVGQSIFLGAEANDSMYVVSYPVAGVKNSTSNGDAVAGVVADATITDNAAGWICVWGVVDYALVTATGGKPGQFLETTGSGNVADGNAAPSGDGTVCGILLEATTGADTVRVMVEKR